MLKVFSGYLGWNVFAMYWGWSNINNPGSRGGGGGGGGVRGWSEVRHIIFGHIGVRIQFL